VKAVDLRTEYLRDPIGIDVERPAFSWNCDGGNRQTAYEIVAVCDGKALWNTGKVMSSAMTNIVYEGEKLESRSRVDWTVTLWDENGEKGESSKAYFEMGLLEAADWKASWVTGNYKPKKTERYPVDCFRRSFKLEKRVKKARLYATACGIYEASINGKKAGDLILSPGYTDYNKRIQYQTIDVTELLRNGENELTFMLADGWYRGAIGAHGIPYEYGKVTKLLAQLEVYYDNGGVDVIATGDDFDWSNDGPITFADNKDGERVDARKQPTYSGKAKLTSHKVRPAASNNVGIKEHEVFEGKKHISPAGKTIADFGQNIAGYISFEIDAHEGTVIKIRLGELLDKNGELTLKNIQTLRKGKPTPLQETDYICKEGRNSYKTRFAISGFQYAEISFEKVDEAEEKRLSDSIAIKAYAVYSDISETGFFESSNMLLNRFVDATKWSVKGNSADIPTDCPTRERHGWTGDAQLFYKSAAYLFDYTAFAKKFLRDVYDWQKKSGRLPMIAPYGGVDFYMDVMNGSVGWSDIGVFYPWQIYEMTGDKRILEEYYEGMKAYAGFMIRRCNKWGGVYAKPVKMKGPARKYLVNAGQSYDEWAEPQDVKQFVWTDFAAPHPEVSTAYTAYVMDHMIKIAEMTGHDGDVALYKEYAEGCRYAYREMIKQDPEFSIDTDRQARLVRPIKMKLLNEETEQFAKKRLVKAMENYGWRLGTGFLSTPFILDVLKDIDVEYAYKLLENEEIPGWLSMPKAGATTIWESWEGANAQGEVGSLNHYSKGALCEWLFRVMCGIVVKENNSFEITPVPGGRFSFASAGYRSVYGSVSSGWRKTDDGNIEFTVELPSNTTAILTLPGCDPEQIGPGKTVRTVKG